MVDEGGEKCAVCDPGYAVFVEMQEGETVNTCLKENDETENCLYLDNEGMCAMCDLGFYQSNKKCLETQAYTS